MPGSDLTRRLLLIGGDGGHTGVPRYLSQMVRALGEGADITVLSDVNEGGFDALRGSGARHLTLRGLKTTRSPFRAARTLSGLRAILKTGCYDLVWAHARMAVLLLRALLILHRFAPAPQGCRYAITHHSLPFEDGYPQPFLTLLRWLERFVIAVAVPHHIWFLSETARRKYCAAMPPRALARHHLHVLESCSDLEPLPPSPRVPGDPRVLVMTGRASRQKNLRAAIRIFARLPENYRLILSGAGTDTPAFRTRLAADLTPAQLSRVEPLGPVADVAPLLARASGYLLTSRYEGMPIGALEAWQAGLPLALPGIDGTSDILARHPLALRLSLQDPARDAAGLYDLLTRYLSDPTVWRARITGVWAQHHAFDGWAARLRAGLRDMLF